MKDVVTIVPIHKKKYLMQLRDENKQIAFPGKWGFFGGSIETNEMPYEAAKRELLEEITYDFEELILLNEQKIERLNVRITTFYCQLLCDINKLKLKEGMDLKLVDKNEIISQNIYSLKLNKFFPTVDDPYLLNTINEIEKELKF